MELSSSMSKQIQKNEEIYLAVGILGKFQDGAPVAIDQRTGETLDPRNIDHKIKIYEREVKEWFLNIASSLNTSNSFNNGFIVLMICMAYFEGVGQYRSGGSSKKSSKKCFKNSIKKLYPERFTDAAIEKLYDKSRCGLFHDGMVKSGVTFSYDFDEPINFSDNEDIIQINPRRLLEDIKNDFEEYLNNLKGGNEHARKIFDEMFSVLGARDHQEIIDPMT